MLDGRGNATGFGITFDAGGHGRDYVTIQDFEIKDTCYHGILVAGDHNRIVGNLIHRIGTDAAVPSGSGGCGLFENSGSRYNVIDGNVMQDFPGHCLYLCGNDGTVTNNLFFDWGRVPTNGYGIQVAGYTVADGLLISRDWQDPRFVDCAGNPKVADLSRKLRFDLRLTDQSPGIGKGIAELAPDHDYDGKPRRQGKGMDIGAFQR